MIPRYNVFDPAAGRSSYDEESGKDTIAAVIEGGIYIYEIYILEYRLA